MKYFKTDGIRGEAYTEITLSLMYQLGSFFSSNTNEIVVGIDTRKSSPELAHALIKGINNQNVKYAGVIPTPGLMYYTLKNNCIGIMITASHNLYKDNGIKIFINGHKIDKEYVKEVEDFLDKHKDVIFKDKFNEDELILDESIVIEYIDFIKERLKGVNINALIDGANGAYSYILKELFNPIQLINCEPNGENINLNCGSTSLSSLINKLKSRKYELGIAFDGDGDRLMVVDKYNRIYEGDFLTYIFAKNLNENNKLQGKTVVFTEVVNPGILERVKELNMYYIVVEIGDHNIYTALENGYMIGGEASGHIINKDILPFGDGLINAIELFRILNQENKKINEYLLGINMYASKKVNILIKPEDFNLSEKTMNKIDRFTRIKNITYTLRKSGTEKIVRLFLYQKKPQGLNYNLNKVLRIIRNDFK